MEMGKMKNIENSNWELVAKYLAGETNEYENSKMQDWLAASEDNREAFDESKRAFEKTDVYYRMNRFDAEAAWENVQAQTDPSQSKSVPLKKFRKEVVAQL
jgi:hypothetical protein